MCTCKMHVCCLVIHLDVDPYSCAMWHDLKGGINLDELTETWRYSEGSGVLR